MQSLGTPLATQPLDGVPNRGGLPRGLLYGGIIIVLAGLAYLGYYLLHPAQPSVPSVSTVPVRRDSIVGVVNSTGQIAPWDQAKLAFSQGGVLATIPVKVGDSVKKGDVIATLDTSTLQNQVDQAQAALESAQAKLALVQQGPRAEDVAAAQAVLDAAKAKLAGMQAGGRPEAIASAQAQLAAAQARLHELKAGPQSADVATAKTAINVAQTQVAKAQADLAALTRPPDPLLVQQAELGVEQAKTALWKSQTLRDGLCGQTDIPGCHAADAQVGIDSLTVTAAQNKLQLLQEGPKPEDVNAAQTAVNAAQANLASSQAKLAQLLAGSLPDDIAQAQSAVDAAQETVALQQHPYSDSDIAQQQQAVAQAQAQLDLKKAPYTAADLAGAQAAVHSAQVQLDQAKLNLDQATLRAPFDGTIAMVAANVGEVAGGIPVTPIITVVDPNNLRLDVSVDETDISHVQVGEDVSVTFDALPGQAFTGKVLSIAPNAAVQAGVASYTVSITLQNANGVRPGMTGNADIIWARHDNVMIVPNRAVRTVGDQRMVQVFDGSKVVARPVTIGISDDTNTEIVSGLQVGDQVVIPSTAPTVPAVAGGPKH